MKTKALRLHGKKDLRLDEFELPPITADELLVKIVSDSACMSTYKAADQGTAHKRVPADIAENPIIVGHEFCGEIVEIGKNLADKYKKGQKFTLQPAMRDSPKAAGYSFRYIGGNMTYGIMPKEYIEQGCVLTYEGDVYFHGSLSEPLSCVIGASHANYHTKQGEYVHYMDIKKGGKMALLAGCGPMGLALIDYTIHRDLKPNLLVVTDIDKDRLEAAAKALSPGEAEKHGVRLIYANASAVSKDYLMELTGGSGYDDVFAFAPVSQVVEQADALLAYDGCLNFFAGPADPTFSAKFNFYNVHYNYTHVVGTNAGNTTDMQEAIDMSAAGRLNPAVLVSHIGGLDAAAEVILNLPNLPGFKKLIYNEISLPLTAIKDFKEKKEPLFNSLAEICERHNGLWNAEAERFLLENATKI